MATVALDQEASTLSDREFEWFRSAIRRLAGIDLGPQKKMLVAGRLAKRLRVHGFSTYGPYIQMLSDERKNAQEVQVMVDLLTTNETYFFREPMHFDFIRDHFDQIRGDRRPFRVWSAASSSGEEVYSLAMLFADLCGFSEWEILGTDISTRVLQAARQGLYPIERCRNIPEHYLKRYCLKGTGGQAGKVLMDRKLRAKALFTQVNLNEDLPDVGSFRLVLLRNVLIYFDRPTKASIVQRVIRQLEPGGIFMIGHSETLHGMGQGLQMVRPSVYRKL